MARIQEPITIKRYGNSRLYNANVGRTMSLQDIATSGEDITTIVLKQIIAERVHHG